MKCKWNRVLPDHDEEVVFYTKSFYYIGKYQDVDNGRFLVNGRKHFPESQVICWKSHEDAPEAYKQEFKAICSRCDGKGEVERKGGREGRMHSWVSDCNSCNGTGMEG